MKTYIINILSFLILIYIFLSSTYGIYFTFLYTKDHNFIESLFIGPIIGTFKGFLFPFYI